MHKHHLLPRHVIEWNDPINLIKCTVTEHAEYHRYLWETFNYYEDYIAWQCLSGQIDKEEALLESIRYAASQPRSKAQIEASINHSKHMKGKTNNKIYTVERNRKISISRKGKKTGIIPRSSFKTGHVPWNKGKNGLQSHTEEWKKEQSLYMIKIGNKPPSAKGRKLSEETKQKIRDAHLGKSKPRLNKS